MVELIDLPDLILQAIFCYLPIWQIVQLARMCQKLNDMMQWRFGNVRKLRILGGSIVHKRECPFMGEFFDNVEQDDEITLVLRFSQEYQRTFQPHQYVQFSEDLPVLRVEQIDRMCRWFKNLTHLTVLYVNRWPGDGQSRLIRNFPKLTHLRVTSVGWFRRNFIDWRRVWPAIHSLVKLEHLQLDADLFNAQTIGLDRLVRAGRLRTLLYRERNHPEVAQRTFWNRPEHFAPLTTFGVSQYKAQVEEHFANPQLIRRLKRLAVDEVRIALLERWNFTYWTALETLHITIVFNDDENHFKRILQRLTPLTNLTDLSLAYYEPHAESFRKPNIRFVSAEDCQGLPIFPSIRRFHLTTFFDPHNLHLLRYAFPNANHFEFELRLIPNVDGEDAVQFFEARPFLNQLCIPCKQFMVRAILQYNDNIESFRWLHRQGENGAQELLPRVVLFTKVVGGRTRASHCYTSVADAPFQARLDA